MPDIPAPIETFSPSEFARGALTESLSEGRLESGLSRTAATFLVDRDDHRNVLRLQFATNEEVEEERPEWVVTEAKQSARPMYEWDGSTERVLHLKVLCDDASEQGDVNNIALRTMAWLQAAARPSERWVVSGLDSQWVRTARAAGVAAVAEIAAHQAGVGAEGLVIGDLVRPTSDAAAAAGAVRLRVIERAQYARARTEFVAATKGRGGKLGSVAASVVATILSRPDSAIYDDFVAFYRDAEKRRTSQSRPWPTTDVTFRAVRLVLPEVERLAVLNNPVRSATDILANPNDPALNSTVLRYDPWEITAQIKDSAEAVGQVVAKLTGTGYIQPGTEDAAFDSALKSYQDAVSRFLYRQARASETARARIKGLLDENAGAKIQLRRVEGALDIKELDPAFRPAAAPGPKQPVPVRDDPSIMYFSPMRLWLVRPNQPAWPCVIRGLDFEELMAVNGVPTRIVADIELVEYVESEEDLRVLGFEVDAGPAGNTADEAVDVEGGEE